MSRFRFELATSEDDQQLRSVLSRTSMPGRFSLALQREPDFFRALAVEGPEIQVIACRDRLTNQIVGLGTRSIRERFVSGQVCRVGYLGSLRLLPEFRSATLVARGYQFFKELAQQDRVAWHFTSITDDNQAAVRLLTSGRAGLPIYRRVATLQTLVLTQSSVKRLAAEPSSDERNLVVRKATAADLPDLVVSLNRNNSKFDFSLHYQVENFSSHSQTDTSHKLPVSRASQVTRDLTLDRVHVAWSDGEIVGSLGAWDQRGYKQIVVRSMPASWRWLRPIWNWLAPWHQQPRLVRVGETLRSLCAALVAFAEPCQAVARTLLQQTLSELQPDDYFLLAVDVKHALHHWLKPLARMQYQNGIYIVGWDSDQVASYRSAQPLSLELGCL